MEFKEIGFIIPDLDNDKIDSVGSLSTGGVNAATLVAANKGMFSIKENTYGKKRFTMVCQDGANVSIIVRDLNNISTEIEGENFEVVNVIGGHPTTPILRPK